MLVFECSSDEGFRIVSYSVRKDRTNLMIRMQLKIRLKGILQLGYFKFISFPNISFRYTKTCIDCCLFKRHISLVIEVYF